MQFSNNLITYMQLTKACKSYINLNFCYTCMNIIYIMLYSIIAECLIINFPLFIDLLAQIDKLYCACLPTLKMD